LIQSEAGWHEGAASGLHQIQHDRQFVGGVLALGDEPPAEHGVQLRQSHDQAGVEGTPILALGVAEAGLPRQLLLLAIAQAHPLGRALPQLVGLAQRVVRDDQDGQLLGLGVDLPLLACR
jgi:hypothetical protein